jgi:hypothetical protein
MSDNQTLHLVMVDMSTGARAHLEKLRAFIGDNYADKIAWYRSGRSFHGYGDTLLTGELWVRFMGLLLLANQPSLEPTVDPRWIGHRLLAGYAALRWTKNTEHYLSAPSSIASIGSHRSSSVEVGAVGKKTVRAKAWAVKRCARRRRAIQRRQQGLSIHDNEDRRAPTCAYMV